MLWPFPSSTNFTPRPPCQGRLQLRPPRPEHPASVHIPLQKARHQASALLHLIMRSDPALRPRNLLQQQPIVRSEVQPAHRPQRDSVQPVQQAQRPYPRLRRPGQGSARRGGRTTHSDTVAPGSLGAAAAAAAALTPPSPSVFSCDVTGTSKTMPISGTQRVAVCRSQPKPRDSQPTRQRPDSKPVRSTRGRAVRREMSTTRRKCLRLSISFQRPWTGRGRAATRWVGGRAGFACGSGR
jgi:hypothetical protein